MSEPRPERDGEPAVDRVAALEAEAAALREQLAAAWGQIQAMRASASWRFTYPLRAARRRLPR